MDYGKRGRERKEGRDGGKKERIEGRRRKKKGERGRINNGGREELEGRR